MSAKERGAIGGLPNGRWLSVWAVVLVVAIVSFVWNLYAILRNTGYDTAYLEQVGELRLSAQRIEAAAREAVDGDEDAFARLERARAQFDSTQRDLNSGTPELPSPRDVLGQELEVLGRVWSDVDTAASTIFAKKADILFLSEVATTLNDSIPQLQDQNARVAEVMVSANAPARQVALAERQALLAERIARNVDRMMRGGSSAAEAADQFGEDVEAFRRVLNGMREGDAAAGISRVGNADAVASLDEVASLFEIVSGSGDRIRESSPDLLQAREAADAIVENSPKLLNATSLIAERINDLEGERSINLRSAVVLGVLMLIALVMIGIQSSVNTRRRLALTAETNERNQQAILRLLDELAGLADGDLTTTATVSEDFTGAIADAINYTIDQLRILVSSINDTSKSVSTAAEDAQATALHLAEAAEHQAQEIAGASAAVNEMAITIDQVSSNAAESAAVADRSVALANTGSQVVQNTIGGMDVIREQIQETSKRIKRLGESSQEIGDIVSLINDIADQTNILALNAAIQASMAGDAGRGFAVVADEVQRLAERSGGATKQIEALVKTIQSDTHEAVTSMEQTTAEVVRGARLAEDAGVALEEIESVSKNLAALIQNISNAARQQASSAGHISNTMNIIQEITSQTSAGTTATAQAIGKLADMTDDLRNSVAGFKLPGDERSARTR